MRSPCAGAALDPPLWIVPNKSLSLSQGDKPLETKTGTHNVRWVSPASKAKSSVLSEFSGLENVLFNDFIDDELNQKTCLCKGHLPLCQILFL
jgi:hypothetical protein